MTSWPPLRQFARTLSVAALTMGWFFADLPPLVAAVEHLLNSFDSASES